MYCLYEHIFKDLHLNTYLNQLYQEINYLRLSLEFLNIHFIFQNFYPFYPSIFFESQKVKSPGSNFLKIDAFNSNMLE